LAAEMTMPSAKGRREKCRMPITGTIEDRPVEIGDRSVFCASSELLNLPHADSRQSALLGESAGENGSIEPAAFPRFIPAAYAPKTFPISSRTRRKTAKTSSSLPVALAGSSKPQWYRFTVPGNIGQAWSFTEKDPCEHLRREFELCSHARNVVGRHICAQLQLGSAGSPRLALHGIP
jgi:hypothetical protein